MEKVLLHGILEATIFGVDKLSSGNNCLFFCKLIDRFEGVAKLYATIELGNAGVGRTRLVENDATSPQWCESFRIYCAHKASNVVFSIKQENPIGADVIGKAYFPAAQLLNGEAVDQWLYLVDDREHKLLRDGSKIHVKLRFLGVSEDRNWSKGIKSPQFSGVPYTFFPQRNGCRVTLYQDAHVPDGIVPEIALSDGHVFRPNRCWEDIFDAIYNAKHLIYITGWSVYTKITLVRDKSGERNGSELTLGQVLKKKAKEGVRVLMLVWDDRTSVRLLKEDGVMATHDENTGKYFENTGVRCVLCPRKPDDGQSIVRDLEVSTMFTHHQKIVVVDGKAGDSEKRRIVSFVGGIDLCDGRYDTPSHSIFGTLNTSHRGDFHQPNFPSASIAKGGPREPWHDIHCKLEGPVAWDVLLNFEQRWKKQARKGLLRELKELGNAFVQPLQASFPEDREAWNVQLFRSIDGGAAVGLPVPPKDACRAGLVRGRDHIIDRSIQDAYINAIRRAKSFIYIENQYFLGSSFGWKENEGNKLDEVGASHLVPKELSLKIVSKIEAGERFAVYVVIPMWPEGVPESGSVQAILHWQKMTMEMMYNDIAQALKAKGLEANPKDYLTFFCLGNRETKKRGEYEPKERLENDRDGGIAKQPRRFNVPACFCLGNGEAAAKPERDSDYKRAQKSRRFMIYVHAKMMIVDDEYIIIGSANINQRSMDGARDTEIAMGAYQPRHLSTSAAGPARGQIHGHRLALWHEHMGVLDAAFLQPESIECMRKVNRLAEEYWGLYSRDALEKDLPGHLLSYPIRVDENGDVTSLPGAEFFPDTKARVLGSKSEILPSILTT